MNTYLISDTTSGLDLGLYQGNTESEALDAMARDAGYENYAEIQEIAPAHEGEILVALVEE